MSKQNDGNRDKGSGDKEFSNFYLGHTCELLVFIALAISGLKGDTFAPEALSRQIGGFERSWREGNIQS